MVLFELMTGEYAWPNYPSDYVTDGGIITYDVNSLIPWISRSYPVAFKELLLGMLNPDPDARPALKAIVSCLRELRTESWGPELPPETKWGLDDSLSGLWVRMWTHEVGLIVFALFLRCEALWHGAAH